MSGILRCAMFPNPYEQSPWMQSYHPILLEMAIQLHKIGCECVPTPMKLDIRWLIAQRRTIDVLHIHWPEQYYRPHPRSPWSSAIHAMACRLGLSRTEKLAYLAHFILAVKVCKWLGIPIVWTLHEIYPHGQTLTNHSRLDRIARRYLIRNVEVLVLNCESARGSVVRELGHPKHIVIAPLGNYRKFYTDMISDAEAKTIMGVNQGELVFLYFGTMRQHRNGLQVIEAFRHIQDAHLRLFVVGQCSGEIAQAMERAAWRDWRIRCFFQLIPNDEIEPLFKACDFVVMPGYQYLTSAVVALALSYGRPVIAPRYGCAVDWVGEAGILYDESEPSALIEALRVATQVDVGYYKFLAAQQGEKLSWSLTARKLLEAYNLARETRVSR
jgi:beta-1,4-mannosyltransferase